MTIETRIKNMHEQNVYRMRNKTPYIPEAPNDYPRKALNAYSVLPQYVYVECLGCGKVVERDKSGYRPKCHECKGKMRRERANIYHANKVKSLL